MFHAFINLDYTLILLQNNQSFEGLYPHKQK